MVRLTRPAIKGTVPVIILAGFLGVGKTTVLNHILNNAAHTRIGVIVNDFGSVNIDSILISTQTDQKLDLTNGCVCCSMDGGELDEVLDTVLDSKPDVIIIEASGLAEPADLARLIILSANTKIGYGGLVYLVDAVNFDKTFREQPRIRTHIENADLIALTKTEHAGDNEIKSLLREISAKSNVPIVPVREGELDPELLFDTPKREKAQLSLLQQDKHEHLHKAFRSITFETNAPLAPEKFKRFMDNTPQGIYRIKGIVYFGIAGYEQKYIVQSVAGRWDMYLEEWDKDEKPRTTLVLIGVEFEEKQTLSQLEHTIGESQQMIDIERYAKA